jgi:hypothetical protein
MAKLTANHSVDLNLFFTQLDFNLNWRFNDARITIISPWLKMQGACKEKKIMDWENLY